MSEARLFKQRDLGEKTKQNIPTIDLSGKLYRWMHLVHVFPATGT